MKKAYIALCAIFVGQRYEKGDTVYLTDDQAKAWGTDYVQLVVEKSETTQEEVQVTDLKKLSKDDLIEKCKTLGLATNGSKADLIERITLNEQA